ncbi:hypothetical protein NST63_05565 [Heyndrickxia sp. FSL W8-0496]|uniref:hypothetical protein n=1 Tax=Heyndrickxia sp. FSL W8-0496 TaxID=2954702 RepID=UPI0030F65553
MNRYFLPSGESNPLISYRAQVISIFSVMKRAQRFPCKGEFYLPGKESVRKVPEQS